MEKKLDWMEIIKNLDEFDIRFNPTPWMDLEEVTVKPKEENDNLLDIHIAVAQKVDDLLARLEQETNEPEIWDMSKPSEDNDLTPEKILSKTEGNIVNR